MVLEAPEAHELVHQHPVLGLVAVADELHQVLVPQLPKEEHLSLRERTIPYSISALFNLSVARSSRRWSWLHLPRTLCSALTHQPLLVPLRAAFQVEVLDGDVLRAEARAERLADGAPVDRAEPAAAEVVGAGEAGRGGAELGVGEGVQVGPGQRERQVLRGQHLRRAEARERHPRRRRPRAVLAPPPCDPPPPRRRAAVVLDRRAAARAAAQVRPPRLGVAGHVSSAVVDPRVQRSSGGGSGRKEAGGRGVAVLIWEKRRWAGLFYKRALAAAGPTR